MRGVADAVRSLKRYVAEQLGEEWEVRLWDEAGSYDFPFARVATVGTPTYSGARLWRDVTQGMTVHAYPRPTTDVTEAVLHALEAEDKLYAAFHQTRWPLRVPIWDYDGVPSDEPAVYRERYDWMRVAEFGTEQMVSPVDDGARWAVCNLRLTWARTAQVAGPYKIVQNVRLESQAS